jgi:phage tail-like protein
LSLHFAFDYLEANDVFTTIRPPQRESPMATQRDDPYGGFNFLVELPGIIDPAATPTQFAEISGLSAEVAVIEYRSGGDRFNSVRKIPGLTKYTNIVLKRGVSGDLALWQWINQAIQGNVQRLDGAIVLLDEARNPVLRWRFRRAWPCRYEGPSLSAKGNDAAIETLEICHEGLEID